MIRYLTLFISLFTFQFISAQCDEGQVEVYITVYTDPWGYETYWELLNQGNACGDESLFVGGNVEVGCDGAGDQDAPGGGYDNNSIFIEGPFCLDENSSYDILFIDDYGDGGLIFEVSQDGILTDYFVGTGEGNTFTFTAGDFSPAFQPGDIPCEALEIEVDGDPLLVDNTEATILVGEVAPPQIGCAVYGAWCDSNGGVSNTMWVSFTAPDDGQYEISTCNENTTFDTAIAVYEAGTCNDFESYTVVSSNDDAYGGCGQGNGFASVCYVSCLEAGQEYLIQIDGWGGETGIAELTVTSVEVEAQLDGFVRDVACANVKGETGSRIIPQLVGHGVNYDIQWEGPFGFTSNDWIIEDMPPGEYTCTVTGACGVSETQTFTVNQPAPVTTNITIENTSCFGAGNGGLEVTAQGGIEPYEYVWSGPNEFLAFETALDSLVEGNYQLEITDDNDCVYNSSVTVDTEPTLEFSLGEDQEICLNQFIFFEGPVGFYMFEWQNGSTSNSQVFSAFDSGVGQHDVTLTILNEDGCTYTDVTTVTVSDCVGVDELDASISVYPNPASGFVTVELGSFNAERVELTDVAGRVVKSGIMYASEFQFDLEDLPSGMYNLIIKGQDGVFFTRRLIVE